jgi:hypothetical protein
MGVYICPITVDFIFLDLGHEKVDREETINFVTLCASPPFQPRFFKHILIGQVMVK